MTIGAGGFEGLKLDVAIESVESVEGEVMDTAFVVFAVVVIVEKVVLNFGALGGSIVVMNLDGDDGAAESWY